MQPLIPPGLAAQAELGPDWASWLDALPKRVDGLLDDWSLTSAGDSMHGFCSLVVPVRTESGTAAVLKLSWDGDEEGLHEGLALQRWAGDGAVRMLRADPRRRALLLERLSAVDLTSVPDLEACEIVARMYARVHVPALPQLATVTSFVATWLDSLAELGYDGPLPRRLVDQALELGRAFVADPLSTGRIIHGDLHYENVLAADREPWLIIDPKPMSGDPHFELSPMLWNRWDELVASGDVRTALRRRFHTLVDAGELDEARARDWVIVRSLINANWSIEDAVRLRRDLDAEERDWITMCLTTAKAVQD